jgi:hypothetical protein
MGQANCNAALAAKPWWTWNGIGRRWGTKVEAKKKKHMNTPEAIRTYASVAISFLSAERECHQNKLVVANRELAYQGRSQHHRETWTGFRDRAATRIAQINQEIAGWEGNMQESGSLKNA